MNDMEKNWPPFTDKDEADRYARRPQGKDAALVFVLNQVKRDVLLQINGFYLLVDYLVVLLDDSWESMNRQHEGRRFLEGGRVPPNIGWASSRQPIAWRLLSLPIK